MFFNEWAPRIVFELLKHNKRQKEDLKNKIT